MVKSCLVEGFVLDGIVSQSSSGGLVSFIPTASVAQVDWLLVVHIFIATVSIAILLVAFFTGLVMLLEEHRLKLRKPAPFSLRVPSLPAFEKMLTRLLRTG